MSKVDTSAMFKNFFSEPAPVAPAAPAEEPQVKTETVPAEQPVKAEAEIKAEPKKAPRAAAKAESKEKNSAKVKERSKANTKTPAVSVAKEAIKKQSSVKSHKVGFYITPENNEALQVKIMEQQLATGSLSSKTLSKFINEALEAYLTKELKALEDVDINLSSDERVRLVVKNRL